MPLHQPLFQKINLQDLEIFFQKRNSEKSKTVLVLHGWATKGTENWQSFLDKLAGQMPNYEIWSLDLPGFGKSEQPNEIWGAAEYASFIKVFLDKFEVQPDIILAHSFGGAIAVHYLHQFSSEYLLKLESDSVDNSLVSNGDLKPDCEPQLILLSPAIVRPATSFIKNNIQNIFSLSKHILLSLKLESVYKKLRKIVYKFYGSTDYLNSSQDSNNIMAKIFLKVIKEDYTNLLENVPNKTLILWGKQDVQTPLWQAKVIHSKLANSQLIVIENARHAIHIQAEKEVLEEIKIFLK